jgi:UDP-4-amino-4,6-dideoxy-N-acetyl-beta-L-altrosamine N-acetyltransferase
LIGPRYALLRPEFAQLRAHSLERHRASQLKHLMISMGGVDANNATGKVLDALQQVSLPDDCRITVVLGGQAPWLASVREQAAHSHWPCEVLVDAADMAQLMADSDLAIGAAGSTAWERCCLGLPSLIAVLADNQREGARALVSAGCAYLLGDVSEIAPAISTGVAFATDAAAMARMSEAARAICDGQGLERVLRYLLNSDREENNMPRYCHVRRMVEGDLEQVLAWRNHPDVRRFMYTQHEIGLAEHRAWFERASQDEHRHLLIVEEEGLALGFVQFNEPSQNGVAEWGFYAAPNTPKGTGRKLAHAALDHAFGALGFHKVCGQALDFNERSIAFHRSLGFIDESVLREQYFDGDRYHAVHCFGLLASEWHHNLKS